MSTKVLTGIVKTDVHDHWIHRVRMQELENLLQALGFIPVHRIVQARRKPTASYVFGSGKVEEIKEAIKEHDVDLFAIYNIIGSRQKWSLEDRLGVDVVDRYEVTLQIFQKEAKDILSKLQIELASLRKSFPHVKFRASLKYKRARAGFKGGGEYAYHRTLRAMQKRIKRRRDKIEKLLAIKEDRILRRLENGSIVVLSGYYNAGKTSLFNALTGLDKPVSDAPFTTLSSKYASIMGGNTYLVDTIGFVLDLDPRLLHSFRLNLLDLEYSGAVVLVVDASENPELMKLKLNEGLRLLKGTRGSLNSLIIALNKIDGLGEHELLSRIDSIGEQAGSVPCVPISARSGEGLEDLLAAIKGELSYRES